MRSGGEGVLKKYHPEIILSVHAKHIKDLRLFFRSFKKVNIRSGLRDLQY